MGRWEWDGGNGTVGMGRWERDDGNMYGVGGGGGAG